MQNRVKYINRGVYCSLISIKYKYWTHCELYWIFLALIMGCALPRDLHDSSCLNVDCAEHNSTSWSWSWWHEERHGRDTWQPTMVHLDETGHGWTKGDSWSNYWAGVCLSQGDSATHGGTIYYRDGQIKLPLVPNDGKQIWWVLWWMGRPEIGAFQCLNGCILGIWKLIFGS